MMLEQEQQTLGPIMQSVVTSESGRKFFIDNFYGHSPHSSDSRMVVVSYKHEVLVNLLVKLA